MTHTTPGADQIRREAAAVAEVADSLAEPFDAFVDRLLHLEGRAITSAVGNSGAIAARMAHVWALSGIPAFHLDAGQAGHGAVGAVQPGDTVVVISKGGETEETNLFAQMSIDRGAFVLAVTCGADSTLAGIASAVQVLPATDADYADTVGMGSSLAQAAWGDAVAAAVMDQRGVDRTELESRHPGGSVGVRARQQGADDA
jgi:D-arabinose 5-phosphate isomerase GutQ